MRRVIASKYPQVLVFSRSKRHEKICLEEHQQAVDDQQDINTMLEPGILDECFEERVRVGGAEACVPVGYGLRHPCHHGESLFCGVSYDGLLLVLSLWFQLTYMREQVFEFVFVDLILIDLGKKEKFYA